MPYIQLNDQQFTLRTGEHRVGTGDDADIRLPGEQAAAPAILVLTADSAVIRRAANGASVKVNGVQLGVEPTPLIHGDKIEVAGHELTYGDDKKGGSTQFVSASELQNLVQARAKPMKPTAATGGRLVSLVDGREYPIGGNGVVIGRDPGCDVVVPSTEVSRRHANVAAGSEGYILTDTSTNGVLVNGVKVNGTQLLGRGDVIRVANEEFRFYADAAAKAAAPADAPASAPPMAAASAPASPPPMASAEPTAPAHPAAPPPRAEPPVSAPPGAMSSTPAPAPVSASASAASQPMASGRSTPQAAPREEPARATGSRPALAVLEIVNAGPTNGTKFEIRSPLTHVGRGEHNDIVINDDSVSDTHAKIQKRDEGWYVVDLGSTNGTYVGGRRIDGEGKISGSPDVRFGGVKMVFRASEAGADEGKGTRAIAGISRDDAQRQRAAAATKDEPKAPAKKGGIPAIVWVVVGLAVIGAVAFFMMQSR